MTERSVQIPAEVIKFSVDNDGFINHQSILCKEGKYIKCVYIEMVALAADIPELCRNLNGKLIVIGGE